ncbi:rCG21457, partial [Rattus norvegicus]
MPDLYFYRDPEDIEKEEQAAVERAVTKDEFQGEQTALALEFTTVQREAANWSSSSFPQKTGMHSQPLRTGQQLPQCRPLSGLELPLSGP